MEKIYPNDNKSELDYELPIKQSKITYANGDIYEGELKYGERNGQGTMKYANGDIYKGEWYFGYITGRGSMTYANNGGAYHGEWDMGTYKGIGTYIYADGSNYTGEWDYGKHNGQGIMSYANDDCYDGEWKMGHRNGRGKMAYANDDYYDGEWKMGYRNGLGKMTYANGDCYDGGWMMDIRNGQGKMTYFNGSIYEGEWKYDDQINGCVKFKDNTINKFSNNEYIDLISDKPEELKSVKTKQQKFGDCWANTIARNFIRTFQILDVIKSIYIEQFYNLFYTILTINEGCDKGGTYLKMFYLLDYIKNNYKNEIFDIKYESSKCNKEYVDASKLSENILKLTSEDKSKLINDLTYLFDNDLLFIGMYEYVVESQKENNKPSKAIMNMLNFRLQPYVSINLNKYFDKYSKIPSNTFPSIPSKNNFDNSCVSDPTINSKIARHAVNLRRWNKNGIEFKNSWGTMSNNNGNFSVKDLKYLICDNNDKIVIFISLMFNYDAMNNEVKQRINLKLANYHKTYDDDLETEETTRYTGFYNKYGLFHGQGKMIYHNNITYEGEWENGLRNRGIITDSDGTNYEVKLKNNQFNEQYVMINTKNITDGINNKPIKKLEIIENNKYDNIYMNKYLKYKMKYIQLKNKFN